MQARWSVYGFWEKDHRIGNAPRTDRTHRTKSDGFSDGFSDTGNIMPMASRESGASILVMTGHSVQLK
jgi:hypothetical protein